VPLGYAPNTNSLTILTICHAVFQSARRFLVQAEVPRAILTLDILDGRKSLSGFKLAANAKCPIMGVCGIKVFFWWRVLWRWRSPVGLRPPRRRQSRGCR